MATPITLSSSFQSAPLREGRHNAGHHANVLRQFQSAPLREGRLSQADRDAPALLVSIRAPA